MENAFFEKKDEVTQKGLAKVAQTCLFCSLMIIILIIIITVLIIIIVSSSSSSSMFIIIISSSRTAFSDPPLWGTVKTLSNHNFDSSASLLLGIHCRGMQSEGGAVDGGSIV